MKVIKAENLGFCHGVDLAVRKAESAVEESLTQGRKVYFYGELVHNAYVSGSFLKKGAIVIRSLDEDLEPGVLISRTHGITDGDRKFFQDHGFQIVDTTCPVVLHGQELVRTSPCPVLVFGKEGHAEVNALCGVAKGECYVVPNKESLRQIPTGRKYRGIVQTTFSAVLLEEILQEAEALGLEVEVANSICSASKLRRKGVSDLKDSVDAFVIVGDKKSANTRELVVTAQDCGLPTFFVDGTEELPEKVFSYNTVGVTAGASTPAVLYDRVCRKLEGKES